MICPYYRWRVSVALDSDAPSARLPERHLRRCPACREFLERSLQMAEALREEPISAPLHIVPDTANRPARRMWRPATVGLAAAACLAFVVLLPTLRRALSPEPAIDGPKTPVTVSLPALPALSAERLLAQVREPVESLTSPAGEPLRREIERTQNRVAAVGRDIVACLPTSLMPRSHRTK